MIGSISLIDRFSNDIDEMEKMLNEYLQFSSESSKEQNERFEFNELIQSLILKFNKEIIQFIPGKEFYFTGRKLSIGSSLETMPKLRITKLETPIISYVCFGKIFIKFLINVILPCLKTFSK